MKSLYDKRNFLNSYHVEEIVEEIIVIFKKLQLSIMQRDETKIKKKFLHKNL